MAREPKLRLRFLEPFFMSNFQAVGSRDAFVSLLVLQAPVTLVLVIFHTSFLQAPMTLFHTSSPGSLDAFSYLF